MFQQGQDGGGNRFYSDKPFEWRPGRRYIPAWQFAGLDYEATGAADIKSTGTGTPSSTNLIVTEINTSGVTGINMTTAGNSLCHLLEIFADMDIAKAIYFSVYWTANNTSGSTDWDVFYKAIVPNTTVLGPAEAATALTTGVATQTMAGTAFTVMRTAEGVLAGGTLAENVEQLNLTVVMNALVTITTTTFVALALRYSPRRLRGPDGMAREAKAPIALASKIYN